MTSHHHLELATADIQGLVVRGYGPLPEARFVLLEVLDAELGRRYLRGLCDRGRINTAADSPDTFAIQVAFTARGLEKLEVPEPVRKTFSREFIEGMDDEVRAESLGDRGANDPAGWEWGRKSHDNVHVLLMIYAKDRRALRHVLGEELALIRAGAFRAVVKKTRMLADQKEHFGWKDGISMPNIRGVPRERPRKKQQPSWTGALDPGEFVLGYRNEYRSFSESPTAELADDPAGHLPLTADGARKDLGRNGTYLVYRELIQHVHALWRYLADSSREPGGDLAARAIALGAKMVGRWPGGAPLVSPHATDDPAHALDNEFTFHASDPVGLACPVGAHIRRANPRDALAADREAADSVTMVRKHQMIRRGRPFGPPVSEKMITRELLDARGRPDRHRRGLHFICLVGNISRQFEFVQRNWVQSANFGGLYKDGDPITGARRPPGDPNANDEFTCPATPVRRKYKTMPQFTTLTGGAYFFLPGIAALRFIARHP